MSCGFFAIGVYHPKHEVNIGGLFRSADLYGAAFIFTVGRRYTTRQASDTPNTRLHTPMLHFDTVDDLRAHLPYSAPLVGIELDPRAQMLGEFTHPDRAVYLLGAEDHGLPLTVLDQCHHVVQIPTPKPQSMNVATAGALILHDRYTQKARVNA